MNATLAAERIGAMSRCIGAMSRCIDAGPDEDADVEVDRA